MRFLNSAAYACSASAALALLAGCSGSGGGSVPLAAAGGGTVPQSFVQQLGANPSVLAPGTRAARSNPITSPGDVSRCPKTGVIYVSDASNAVVNEYALVGKNQKMCGQITGLSQPQGIDTDAKGNLYVANTGTSQILVFAPGRTKPSKTINDTGFFPVGVEAAKNGTIVVTNICAAPSCSAGTGNVVVFSSTGKQIGRALVDRNAPREYFVTTDSKNNIFTTYQNSSGTGGVNEFLAPSYKKVIDLPINLSFPGGLDYEGTNLLVDDQTAKTVTAYAAPRYNKAGKAVTLTSASDPVTFDFVPRDNALYTADAGAAAAQEYSYPGGALINTIMVGGQPIGVAVYLDDAK